MPATLVSPDPALNRPEQPNRPREPDGGIAGELEYFDEFLRLSAREQFGRRAVGASPPIRVMGAGPRWVTPTIDALTELVLLRDDWDGYGAPPIDHESVNAALRFLSLAANHVTPPPAVIATGMGTVQLEWRDGDVEIDVEISPDGTYDAVYEGPEGEQEWRGNVWLGVADQLRRYVGLLMRGAAEGA